MEAVNPMDKSSMISSSGGYKQNTNLGTGEAKEDGAGNSSVHGGSNGHGGGDLSKVHHRPSTKQDSEYSYGLHDGTGLSK